VTAQKKSGGSFLESDRIYDLVDDELETAIYIKSRTCKKVALRVKCVFARVCAEKKEDSRLLV
jgi:hypothetical protein